MQQFVSALILGLAAAFFLPTPAVAQESFQDLIAGADVRAGGITLYAKEGQHLMSLPPDELGKVRYWSAEVARYPSDAIAISGTEIATHAVTMERQGNRVLVRSLSSGSIRAGDRGGFDDDRLKVRPIDIAISNAQIGPVVLALDILAEDEDGAMLLDMTEAFSSDIADYSVKQQLASTGITPLAVDPARSYISTAAAFPENIFVVSHLTFVAQDQMGRDRAVSVEVAHTIALLPDDPMERRVFDPRVGYFTTEVLEFESADGQPAERVELALRHRLVHADPTAPLPSDPVEPLVYYLSPEIPQRWRPYVRAAVEDWQPAFEAAGFSNAIIAADAPTPAEDPDWSINDARYNVIRWVAQPIPNALGPNVHDPRTGEILSAHILVWPELLNVFGNYYHLLMSRTDPLAMALPLPEALQGRILRYAVSHEVGHTLGLRHNHRASTAWTIDQLRDPAFTARNGSTASIMAYGRFNYVAQPGDGMEQFFPVISSYDTHAIQWGYTPNLDASVLDAIAARSHSEPQLIWGAAEKPSEVWGHMDAAILTENIGADRIAATQAGVEALRFSLDRLPQTVGAGPARGDAMARVYDQAIERYMGFMDGVAQMIGGLTSTASDGAPTGYVSAEDQRAAISYLMSDAISDIEMFADPALLAQFRPMGGIEGVNTIATALVQSVLEPTAIRRVYAQDTSDPTRDFGVAEMLQTITQAILGDAAAIEDMPPARRAAIAEYVRQLQALPDYAGDPFIEELAFLGFPQGFVDMTKADLSDTGIADAATSELESLVHVLVPEEDGLATRLFKDVEGLLGIKEEGDSSGADIGAGDDTE